MPQGNATISGVATLPLVEGDGGIMLVCAVCRNGFPIVHPHPFPICPDCLRVLKERVEDSKSNWHAGSAGGEPNHR